MPGVCRQFTAITVETVTSLTCTDDLMKIRVNVTELKWLYNDTNPGYISLINEGCTGSTTGDTWAIDNPHSQCYTQRQVGLVSTGARGTQQVSAAEDVLHSATGRPGVDRCTGYTV